MEVAFDPAPCLVASGDDTGARSDQVVAGLDVGDRAGDKVREVGEPRLRIVVEDLAGEHHDHAPQGAFHHDRRADDGAEALLIGGRRVRCRLRRPVIDPRGTSGLHHPGRDILLAFGDRVIVPAAGSASRTEEDHRTVLVIAADIDARNSECPAGLARDRIEDRGWRGLLGHQRRDPAQRRTLLLRQAAKFVTCLSVRYRTGNQVGVVGQPRLAAGRKNLVGFAVGGEAPPDRAVDDDRRGDRLAEACFPVLGRG